MKAPNLLLSINLMCHLSRRKSTREGTVAIFDLDLFYFETRLRNLLKFLLVVEMLFRV